MKRMGSMIFCALLAANAAATLTVGPKKNGQCMLYEHRDMQGARMHLPHGDDVSFASADIGSTAWREKPTWNDVVSSAKVDRQCHLTVWEHSEGRGASRQWNGGGKGLLVKYVGDAWNDRISSASCLCD